MIYVYHEALTEDNFLEAMRGIDWTIEQAEDIDMTVSDISDISGDFNKIYITSKDDVILYYLEAIDNDTALYNYKKWEDKVSTLSEVTTTVSDNNYSMIEGSTDSTYYYFMRYDNLCVCIKTDKSNKETAKEAVTALRNVTQYIYETSMIEIETVEE
jgi:hypothetical protein